MMEVDRNNLLALAELYCEICEVSTQSTESLDESFLLSLYVTNILSDTKRKVKESVQLLRKLRETSLLDEENCHGLIRSMTAYANTRATVEKREGEDANQCADWTKAAGAKLDMHTAHLLVEAYMDTEKDSCSLDSGTARAHPGDISSLALAPSISPVSASSSRDAGRRMAEALRVQFAAEERRSEQLDLAKLAYSEVPTEVLDRHQQLLRLRNRLRSSLASCS